MAKILIESDGTAASTSISVDGQKLDNVKWASLSYWPASGDYKGSINVDLVVSEKDESGLMQEKRLSLAKDGQSPQEVLSSEVKDCINQMLSRRQVK